MRLVQGSRNFHGTANVVATLGVFDGVHRGHRGIFRQVVARARALRATSLVYTFEPHPARILAPESAPLMINNPVQKRELVASEGIRVLVVERFTEAFALLTPQQFFNRILAGRLKARELFVGHDFTFGVHRSGTTEDLQAMGRVAGIGVTVVPAFLWGGRLVSSTAIRQLLARGNLAAAEGLLGRPYFLEGRVVRGRGIGGRELGIHTANVFSENDLILPSGVYITRTWVAGRPWMSVTNIGTNPTFGPGPLSIETHILKFRRSILRQRIRIEFFEKLREELVFTSTEALAAQIGRDIEDAKKFLKNRRDHR